MVIRQHIPSFIDGCYPKKNIVKTVDDLLRLDWIASWSKNDFDGVPFWRYSESPHGNEWVLMGEWKNETKHKWWVLGYMSENIGLPIFLST